MDARWDFKSHLTCTSRENFGVVELTIGHTRWTWGEIWKVISHAPWWSWHLATLDGCKVKFEKSSRMHLVWELWCGGGDTWSHWMDVRWDLKVISCAPCMRTLVVKGTLGHTRWMRAEIWKVILHAPCMRTLLLDLTSLMSQGQMRKICRRISPYIPF